ncbi:MAG: permease [Oscillospiraceae bacterium]|nr:permease [Oscillospiraceae bacterium]
MFLNEFRIVFSSIITLILEISPYWVSGLVLGSIVSVYLSDKIASKVKVLGEGRVRIPALFGASVLGVVSPLCMYGTMPVIAAFRLKGVPQNVLVAFMISSVLLNPNLFVLGFVLGAEIAVARLVLAILCGLLAGILVSRFMKNREIFRFERFTPKDKAKRNIFRDMLRAFQITAPYLLIGVTVTALVNRYVPPDLISNLFGTRRALGVLFATSISIPLYACGGGIMPLLRAWMHAGMGAGDALAFMIAGPATKITNLAAVKMILGGKNFAIYLAYIILFAMVVGIIIETVDVLR